MKKQIKILLTVIGLFIAIVLIINTSPFDEKLNPAITKIMKVKPMPKIEGNAYYAIMGLGAASDKNIIKTGRTLITHYQNNRKQGNDNLSDKDSREILGIKNNIDEQWLEKYGECNSHTEDDCLLKLSELLLNPLIDKSRLTLMLKRYNEVLSLPYYANFNDITIGTPLPSYRLLLKLGSISLAQHYNATDKTDFLLHLDKEITFWKMVLLDGEMIIDKMIAQASIRNNLDYLSTYLRNNQPSAEQIDLIQSILTPLTEQELDISDSYISESRTMFKAINALKPFDEDFNTFLLQKNAHHNLMYKYFTEPNVTMSRMATKDIYQAIKNGKMEKINKQKSALVSYNPSSLYNLTGKSMIAKSFCDNCWYYAARLHDLNNIFNLVQLQLELTINETSNVAEYISKSSIRNNFTDEPFDFDALENTIKFQCMDANYTKCSVKL